MNKKVLVLYSSGEFPPRKTVKSFLYSFRNYSNCLVYYHNMAFLSLPYFLRSIEFDVVIFSHFMTTPWNRVRYSEKIMKIEKMKLKSKVRVAFFQDEYFNTDLTNEFINRIKIHHVFSVAPPSEWSKIYASVDSKTTAIHQYLTGYIDEVDVVEWKDLAQKTPRDIDVGYRTGWPSKSMFRLGHWGALKFKVADLFNQKGTNLNLNIKVGNDILTGETWFKFLCKCRFTLGVESGASLLDATGEIQDKINEFLVRNPNADFESVQTECFKDLDGNLELKAISPRVFEAAITRVGLICVEGSYNGILIPHTHYIPLAQDFSNIDSVLAKVKDERVRLAMVERTYDDLVKSGNYSYTKFVKNVFEVCKTDGGSISLTDKLFYKLSCLTDVFSWFLAAIWSNFILKIKKLL